MSLGDVPEARELTLVDPQLHRCFLFDLPGPLKLLLAICILILVVRDVPFQFGIFSFEDCIL